jgi:predicted tellurium resistance membrane protein TerC
MSDWTTDAADAIENAVALVRERTVEPVHALTRVLVYGLLVALIMIPALVLLTIALFRMVEIATLGYTWIAWMALGGIFAGLGGLLWTRRTP